MSALDWDGFDVQVSLSWQFTINDEGKNSWELFNIGLRVCSVWNNKIIYLIPSPQYSASILYCFNLLLSQLLRQTDLISFLCIFWIITLNLNNFIWAHSWEISVRSDCLFHNGDNLFILQAWIMLALNSFTHIFIDWN